MTILDPLDRLDRKTFLAHLHPFSQLPELELERLARALTVGHHHAGEVLLKAGEAPACLYLIIDGAVWEADDAPSMASHPPDDAPKPHPGSLVCVIAPYTTGDVFDVQALLEGTSQRTFVASEPTRCYRLPRDLFLHAVQTQPALASAYPRKMAQRFESLRGPDEARGDMAAFAVAKIRDAYIHPPTFVAADTSIHETALAMKANKTKSVLVRCEDEIGIVTATDLREAAIVQRQSVDAPVGTLANYELIDMAPDDFLFNALLRMTRHDINRLVIREGSTIHGILEQIDLLSYLSNHSHLIALQIERAISRDELKWASHDLVNVVRDLHNQGTKIRYIMQLVSELNKKVLRKLFELLAPPDLLENSCLLVLGSEGREEQVLKTDQDNALILRDDFSHPELERLTGEFTECLLEFGYPRCPGNIMVSNPYWTKSVAAFKDELFEWIVHPTPDSFLQFAIFCDAKVVAGDENLLRHVKDRMYRLLGDHRAFFGQFARSTVAFETPLGFFTNFVLEKNRAELDIKKGGIFPIVHGVRSLALEYRLPQTNTVDRITALSQRNLFQPSFGAELIEAFNYLSTLRTEAGLEKALQGLPQDNYLNPKELNKLKRELLRDSFKIVNEFKKFITYHFKLGMIG
ncbi:MAG: putative nucleotidyltransferase substrate binding domain-containing protein [Candidatus Contendobacter sp.]|nr:putative nucleotidyltransferase substrate binding domain-containing protein [Candidatus Contendobacter sp.]MDG4557317.1 putative nucleotidyltransferase substrate binding domain-containing protein [Candidatus Contendobacter sp.]